jgi:hypothetical protein
MLCRSAVLVLSTSACAQRGDTQMSEESQEGYPGAARRTPYWIDPPLGGAALLATQTAGFSWRAERAVPGLSALYVDGHLAPDGLARVERNRIFFRYPGASLVGRHRIEVVNLYAKGQVRSQPVVLRIDSGDAPPLRPRAAQSIARVTQVQREIGGELQSPSLWGISADHPEVIALFQLLATDDGWQLATTSHEFERPFAEAKLAEFAATGENGAVAWTWRHLPNALYVGNLDPRQITVSVMQTLDACELLRRADARLRPEACEFGRLAHFNDGLVAEIRAPQDVESPRPGAQKLVYIHDLREAENSVVTISPDHRFSDQLLSGQWLRTVDGARLQSAAIQGDGLAILEPETLEGTRSLQTLVPSSLRAASPFWSSCGVFGAFGDLTLLSFDRQGEPQFHALAPHLGLGEAMPLAEPIAGPIAAPSDDPQCFVVGGTPYFVVAREPPATTLLLRSNGSAIEVQALPHACEQVRVHRSIEASFATLACVSAGNFVQFALDAVVDEPARRSLSTTSP